LSKVVLLTKEQYRSFQKGYVRHSSVSPRETERAKTIFYSILFIFAFQTTHNLYQKSDMIVELFFIWLITSAEFTSAFCRYKGETRCNGNEFSWYRSGSKYDANNTDLFRTLEDKAENYTDLEMNVGSMAFYPNSTDSKMLIYTTDCEFRQTSLSGTPSLESFPGERSDGHEFFDLSYTMSTSTEFTLTDQDGNSVLPSNCSANDFHTYPLGADSTYVYSFFYLGEYQKNKKSVPSREVREYRLPLT